jgi:hypothetical protein
LEQIMIRSPSGLSRFPIAPAGERSPHVKPNGKAAPSTGAPKRPRPPKSKNRS